MNNLFQRGNPLVGMVHVHALPGSPRHSLPLPSILEHAVAEARVYREAGFGAVMIENMHDRPYLKSRAGPEVVAALSVIGYEVKRETGLPCGIQILAGANEAALAAAAAGGLEFIRVEGFVYAHVADEGVMEGCAGELLRYRESIGAEHIAILTDIKKKHSSHAITADVDLPETARTAEFFLSDGVIVTGTRTGAETNIDDIRKAKDAVSIPVVVGSGATEKNIRVFLDAADGVIVGSAAKQDGRWENPVDPARAAALVKAANAQGTQT